MFELLNFRWSYSKKSFMYSPVSVTFPVKWFLYYGKDLIGVTNTALYGQQFERHADTCSHYNLPLPVFLNICFKIWLLPVPSISLSIVSFENSKTYFTFTNTNLKKMLSSHVIEPFLEISRMSNKYCSCGILQEMKKNAESAAFLQLFHQQDTNHCFCWLHRFQATNKNSFTLCWSYT
jgi:hypothetical protein